MRYVYIIFIFTLCFVCCKPILEITKIEQLDSKQGVILWHSVKMNTIWAISLPIEIKITNSSLKKRSFLNYKYIYGNQLKGKAMKLYSLEKGKVIQNSISKKNNLNAESSKIYLIYSKHFVDTVKFSNIFFKPYIEKMLRLEKDTLHVGTVVEFKKKHKELFESLTKNDSISIRLLDPNSKSGLGERIVVPVNW
ncbi:MAG: hypothetical protein JKX79_01535 [Labilibaculum sp.]|nr:hypothetical protein [Labilibaculum sp.]